jgi:hypothetical protein
MHRQIHRLNLPLATGREHIPKDLGKVSLNRTCSGKTKAAQHRLQTDSGFAAREQARFARSDTIIEMESRQSRRCR